ncbi:MAG: hypothetical protein ACPG7U_03410 [Holosporaceae bacterium]
MKKIILSLSCFLILSTQNLCAFGPLDNPEERHHFTASPRPLHQLQQDAYRHRMHLAKAKESFEQRKGWGTTWRTLHSLTKPFWNMSKDMATRLVAHVVVGHMLAPQWQRWSYQGLPIGHFLSASLQKGVSSYLTSVVGEVEEAAWHTFLTSVLQTSAT